MSIVPIPLTVSASITDSWSAASSDEYTLFVPFGCGIPIGASPTEVYPRDRPVRESSAATVLRPPGVLSVIEIVLNERLRGAAPARAAVPESTVIAARSASARFMDFLLVDDSEPTVRPKEVELKYIFIVPCII